MRLQILLSLGALTTSALSQLVFTTCKGSALCPRPQGHSPSHELMGYVNEIDDDCWIQDNHKIACVDGGICAFLQGTLSSTDRGGLMGAQVKEYAQMIIDDNCTDCGSAKFGKKAVLKFDFVQDWFHGGDICKGVVGRCPVRSSNGDINGMLVGESEEYRSTQELLKTDEFWDDFATFLLQKLQDTDEAEKAATEVRQAWEQIRGNALEKNLHIEDPYQEGGRREGPNKPVLL